MYLTLNIIFSVPFFLHIGVSQSRATDQVSPPLPPTPPDYACRPNCERKACHRGGNAHPTAHSPRAGHLVDPGPSLALPLPGPLLRNSREPPGECAIATSFDLSLCNCQHRNHNVRFPSFNTTNSTLGLREFISKVRSSSHSFPISQRRRTCVPFGRLTRLQCLARAS